MSRQHRPGSFLSFFFSVLPPPGVAASGFVLVLLAASLAACSAQQTGGRTAAERRPRTAEEGRALTASDSSRVVVAIPALPSNFNPSAPAGATRVTDEVMAQVWPQAFVTNSQFVQTLMPGVLSTVEVTDLSPFTVSYTINPRAVWSDGVPITAADFIYNWHEQLLYAGDLADSGLVAGYRAIKTMTSSGGGRTLTVVFKHQFAEWESLFSNLVPAHVAERYGWVRAFEGFDAAKVLSGGPYEITRFVPGDELVLQRNPHWWSTPPAVSEIVFEVMSPQATLAGLADGAVQLAQVDAGPQVASTVADAAGKGIALDAVTSELPYLWQLCFDMVNPTLAVLDVRRALALSIDPATVVADSGELEDGSLRQDPGRLTVQGEPGSGQPSPAPGYGVRTALHLLSLAGYVQGSDGYERLGGIGAPLTLSLLVPSGKAFIAQAADEIVAQLQLVGVRVDIRFVSMDRELGQLLPEGQYEMALAPFLVSRYSDEIAPEYSDPISEATLAASVVSRAGAASAEGRSARGARISLSAREGFSVPGTLPGGGTPGEPELPWTTSGQTGEEPGATVAGVVTRDVFGLDDPIVDRDFSAALLNLNLTTEERDVHAADARLWTDVPSIPLFQQPADLVYEKALQDVSESPTPIGPFWNAELWTLSTTSTSGTS